MTTSVTAFRIYSHLLEILYTFALLIKKSTVSRPHLTWHIHR